MAKSIEFKYTEKDGSIELGVPENVTVENGNGRDGGCNLKFSTSSLSMGIEEKFSLYLFAEDVNNVTRKIWEGYVRTEPSRAKKDIESFIKFLENLKGGD